MKNTPPLIIYINIGYEYTLSPFRGHKNVDVDFGIETSLITNYIQLDQIYWVQTTKFHKSVPVSTVKRLAKLDRWIEYLLFPSSARSLFKNLFPVTLGSFYLYIGYNKSVPLPFGGPKKKVPQVKMLTFFKNVVFDSSPNNAKWIKFTKIWRYDNLLLFTEFNTKMTKKMPKLNIRGER